MAGSSNESFVGKNISVSTAVKSSDGQCGGIFVSIASGASITVYDGTSASGTKIVDTFTPTASTAYAFPFAFSAGLYIAITGTVSLTAFYV